VTEERFVVTRTIAAGPAEVFAVLANPSRHAGTEPGDWVRDSVEDTPITGAGQMFAMNMFLEQAGGDYVTHNLVHVFEQDRAIGWMTGQLDDAGAHQAGGWFWRYDLAPSDGGTDVTLTYDWTATSAEFRERVGGMPLFPAEYIAQSLVALENSLASAKRTG
jgi:hypothetical protein